MYSDCYHKGYDCHPYSTIDCINCSSYRSVYDVEELFKLELEFEFEQEDKIPFCPECGACPCLC